MKLDKNLMLEFKTPVATNHNCALSGCIENTGTILI